MDALDPMINPQFLLDILEDQKQKTRGMDFIREEVDENLAQKLIDELKNMTESEDDNDEEAEENVMGNDDGIVNQIGKYPLYPQLDIPSNITHDRSKFRLIDEHLDPILQREDQIIFQAKNQTRSKIQIKSKSNLNQKTNPNKRTKSDSDRKLNQIANPRKGKKPNLNRDHLGANQRLMQDFFQPSSVTEDANHFGNFENHEYDLDSKFYSKFQLPKNLFLKIVTDLTKNDLHFTQRKDALGNLGHSSYQKVLVAFRQLTHGIGNREVIMDDYIRMAESTALECLIRFCHSVNELYESQYLRCPSESDLRRIDDNNFNRGIPSGFVASLGFKYWQWENRPTGWSGRFKTTSSSKIPPTIVLEALVSSDSWFWYAFFSTPGNCKDIDVFHPNLPIYCHKFQAPQLSSIHSNHSRSATAYYYAHQIYPPIPPIVTSIKTQIDQASVVFEQHHHQQQPRLDDEKFQTICRNDFDRAIEKLESRFQIIKLPCRLWSSNSMKVVIKTVMILHNMIIEDERIHRQHTSSTALDSSVYYLSQSIPTDTTQPPVHHDIQVNPLLSGDAHHLQNTSSAVPAHVLQKLNDRYKSFNPNLSLRI